MVRLAIVGVFLALCGAAAAQEAQAFKLKIVEGHVQKVKVLMKGSLGGMAIEMKYNTEERILKVEPSGEYKEQTKTTGLEVSAGGAPVPLYFDTDKTEVRTLDRLGALIATDDPAANLPLLRRAGRVQVLSAPDAPVKVGDSWTFESKADPDAELPAAKVTYKFVAEEKVGAWDTCKVEIAFAETEGSKPITAKGFLWFNKADFRGVKGEVLIENFPAPAGSPVPVISSTVIFERVE